MHVINQIELKQTFAKKERLYEKKLIDSLFKNGKSFFVFPFKVFYLSVETTVYSASKVLISVPKRNFKKAVDRNRIKRLIREAYRRNKDLLSPLTNEQGCGQSLIIGLIYTAKAEMDYGDVEKKIILILQQLLEKNEQVTE